MKARLFFLGLLLIVFGSTCLLYFKVRYRNANAVLENNEEHTVFARMPLPPNSGCPTCAVMPEIRSVGSIEIDWPQTVKPGTSRSIVLRIQISKEELELGQICSCVPDPEGYLSKIKSDVPLVSPRALGPDRFFTWADNLSANLSASSFDVSTTSPTLQSFELNNAEWRWIISPKASANGSQVITIGVHAEKGGMPPIPNQPLESKKPGTLTPGSKKLTSEVKSNTQTYVYPLVMEELPIEVNQGWVNWTLFRFGGLLTLLTGAGMTIPYARDWWKERAARKGRTKPIGFKT